MTSTVELPEGQEHFKLNEVCKLANVQPYMLRFWGTEFERLEAKKSGTGQRLYSREQVELILEVRRLLFDEGLTIAGARKRIESDDDGTAADHAAAATVDPAAVEREVDKRVGERVQPLLATLRETRDELAALVTELKGGDDRG